MRPGDRRRRRDALLPDDTIQHAGVVLGLGTSGIAAHAYSRRPRGHAGQIGRALLAQTLSAVTAARAWCCGAPSSTRWAASTRSICRSPTTTWTSAFACASAATATLWTPYAELYHIESASRGYEDTPAKRERFEHEVAYMRRRWGAALAGDPAYNPNLSLDGESFTLAFPPRAPRPWLEAPALPAPLPARAGARG